ncbi:MAG: thioesterase domain-containing protein [Pseudomonadota bacterium]
MIKQLKAILTSLGIIGTLLTANASHAGSAPEQVVLLHGIARSPAHLSDLEAFLKKNGYTVFNLKYQSTEHPIEQLTAMVAEDIRKTIDPSKPIHFVGYSMGGIITRAILNKYRPDNLGRVVQLASPNKGSEVADLLRDNWLFGEVFGPAGKQLTTQDNGIDDLLGEVDYELGVIAGNSSIDPISSAIIPGVDDGKVSVESTKIAGMRDHIIINTSHTFFPGNKSVHKQTLHFLRFGVFQH